MKTIFKNSFSRDLKKYTHDKKLLSRIKEIIDNVEEAETTHDIFHFKKLTVNM